MWKLYFFVVLANSLVVEQLFAGTPLTIKLKERNVVETTMVRLDDLVATINGDINKYQMVKNLHMLNIDRVNQYQNIKKDKILHLLRKSKLTKKDFLLEGPENVYVKLLSRPYAINTVVDEIKAKLEDKLSSMADKYQVREKGNIREISLPLGQVTYKYKLDGSGAKKRTCIWVDFFVDKHHYQTIPVWYEQSIFQNVYISKKPIKKGNILKESDFNINLMDITLFAGVVVAKEEHSFVKLRVNKDVRAGEVLLSRNTEVLPSVYKGQDVRVYSSSGSVTIQVHGESVQDGDIGDVVMIRRKGSKSLFKAVVLDNGLVRASGG